jgi:hypothetical protein
MAYIDLPKLFIFSLGTYFIVFHANGIEVFTGWSSRPLHRLVDLFLQGNGR